VETKLANILDECVERIAKGESIDTCLARYPDLRSSLEPLLAMALSISSIPRVSPSDEFRRVSRARLMARLRQEAIGVEAAKSGRGIAILDDLTRSWQRLRQSIAGVNRVAIPVTLILVVALVTALSALNIISPSPALAAKCTLSTLSGITEVRSAGLENWLQAIDGMTLKAGTRVKTAPNSYALLTFKDGSTIKLEENTDIEIQQVEYIDDQSSTIVMKQWLGTTWSQVIKTEDYSSYYRIETPSASAIAHGTLFTTKVDKTGFTEVTTTEGLISVLAQGEEVYLPANSQSRVEVGESPSKPVSAPGPKAELIISFDTPAVGSVNDPIGASTGYLPNGFTYNQITGSRSSSPSEGTQVLTIPQPVTGEYMVILRYVSPGTAHYKIQCKVEGKVVFEYSGVNESEDDGGWVIHLDLQVADGKITSSEVSKVEPLEDEGPEKIVVTKSAKEKSVPIKPVTKPEGDRGKPEEDKGKPEEKDKGKPEEDKGKPEEDKGKPEEDKGKSEGDKGKPEEDRGKPEEDRGKPEEDKGKPEGDKGKPGEDRGKPEEDRGKPEEDRGKPEEDRGKPEEDRGKPEEDRGKPEEERQGQARGERQGQARGERQGQARVKSQVIIYLLSWDTYLILSLITVSGCHPLVLAPGAYCY